MAGWYRRPSRKSRKSGKICIDGFSARQKVDSAASPRTVNQPRSLWGWLYLRLEAVPFTGPLIVAAVKKMDISYSANEAPRNSESPSEPDPPDRPIPYAGLHPDSSGLKYREVIYWICCPGNEECSVWHKFSEIPVCVPQDLSNRGKAIRTTFKPDREHGFLPRN